MVLWFSKQDGKQNGIISNSEKNSQEKAKRITKQEAIKSFPHRLSSPKKIDRIINVVNRRKILRYSLDATANA